MTAHRASDIFGDSLRSGGGLQRQRTAAADRRTVATSVPIQAARELHAEMAATLERIEEFDGDQEKWLEYEERLGYLFDANGIMEEDKKRSVFLTIAGANTYKLLRNLLTPAKPGDSRTRNLWRC